MIYLFCFLLAFATLLYLVSTGKGVDINAVILSIVVVVGNGGYYALHESTNLSEAVLSNKITYVIGCFAPMILFLIICDICRKKISRPVQTALYLIQVIIYLCVCSIGKSCIFYKEVEFSIDNNGGLLTKTYGPVHTFYIITLCLYMVACISVVGISIKTRKCRVSNF